MKDKQSSPSERDKMTLADELRELLASGEEDVREGRMRQAHEFFKHFIRDKKNR